MATIPSTIQENVLDERLSHLAPNERNALIALVKRLHQRWGDRLLHVVLFGSKARGDFDAESDLDVLVVVRMPDSNYWRHWRQVLDSTADIDLKYDVVLSILVRDELEYGEMRQTNLLFNRRIEGEGIELWTSKRSGPISV
jgi:predicted nucleotidyltransferase